MYKVIWLAKFRQDKSREEVLEWWRGHHAELARATPGMLRYVQSHWTQALDPVTQLPTGEPPVWDGHAEHWFADRESYERAMASPEWAATQVDGPNGFERTLLGAELEETVISWHPMDDSRDSI
ncbi:MAG: EthD family reductase [Ilumatobacteraceae bacterium]|uniref:EthD family reductase n=1 Tax=Pseudonocardia sp. TaxID=60912 RepID=UPI003D1265B4